MCIANYTLSLVCQKATLVEITRVAMVVLKNFCAIYTMGILSIHQCIIFLNPQWF
jgi:hypothetical protein